MISVPRKKSGLNFLPNLIYFFAWFLLFYLIYSALVSSNAPVITKHIYHKFRGEVSENEVTIATQLTINRLERLVAMCNQWNGPINAIVYVSLASIKETLKTLDYFINNEDCIKNHVDIHIYYDENISEFESQQVYPANLLRNLGNNLSRTRFVINLDVDFLPNPSLRDILQ